MSSSLEEYAQQLFAQYLESQMSMADYLPEKLAEVAQKMVGCLLQDGKILICGHGASAANALHFSTALIHQYGAERPPLPAVVLSQDMSFSSDQTHVFSRQIQALGQATDLLLMLTTTGDSNSLIHAVDAAKERGMDIVALSGKNGGMLSNHLGPEDLEIQVKLDHPARIREAHLFILHGLCDLIDQLLFGALA